MIPCTDGFLQKNHHLSSFQHCFIAFLLSLVLRSDSMTCLLIVNQKIKMLGLRSGKESLMSILVLGHESESAYIVH